MASGTEKKRTLSFTQGAADLTATAAVTGEQYTITYDANGSSGTAPNAQEITYATQTSLASNALTLDGYAANGWNTKADGTGTSYASAAQVYGTGAALSPTEDMTLYANHPEHLKVSGFVRSVIESRVVLDCDLGDA